MSSNTNMSDNLELAVKTLAVTIKQSESFYNFHSALKVYNQDTAARKTMADLSSFQREIRQKQSANQITQQDLEKLRSLQTTAQQCNVITAYAYAQEEAIGQLREINAEISNLLGIDFASLTKKSGCC